MSKTDVQRFVGLLVSDEKFVGNLTRDFDATVAAQGFDMNPREYTILREGFESFVRPNTTVSPIAGGASPAAPAAVAVGAAVAGAVAGSVATKVVDKLTDSKLATPINMRIRDSILHRGLLSPRDFRPRF